jgi:hypothetical protein
MTKLPTDLSGKELVKILSKIGFVFQRQQGSTWFYGANRHSLAWWFRTIEPFGLEHYGRFSMRLELRSIN